MSASCWPPSGLLHRSDRGSQYVDEDYIKALGAAGIERSMSRAGNCYDNATMESFWSTLKTDTGLDTAIPASRRHAELAVFDYIETFHNPTRRHSSHGYIFPCGFRKTTNTKHQSRLIWRPFYRGKPSDQRVVAIQVPESAATALQSSLARGDSEYERRFARRVTDGRSAGKEAPTQRGELCALGLSAISPRSPSGRGPFRLSLTRSCLSPF